MPQYHKSHIIAVVASIIWLLQQYQRKGKQLLQLMQPMQLPRQTTECKNYHMTQRTHVPRRPCSDRIQIDSFSQEWCDPVKLLWFPSIFLLSPKKSEFSHHSNQRVRISESWIASRLNLLAVTRLSRKVFQWHLSANLFSSKLCFGSCLASLEDRPPLCPCHTGANPRAILKYWHWEEGQQMVLLVE